MVLGIARKIHSDMVKGQPQNLRPFDSRPAC